MRHSVGSRFVERASARRLSSLTVSVSALCSVWFTSGCDVEIFGALELEGEPVRIATDEGWAGGIGVGQLGDRTLLEWMRPGPAERRSVPTVRWFDRDFAPVSEPEELGVGFGHASTFVERDGGLEAYVWATRDYTPATVDVEVLRRVRLEPGLDARITTPEINAPLPEWEGNIALRLGLARYSVGRQALIPAVLGEDGGLYSIYSALIEGCSTPWIMRTHILRDDASFEFEAGGDRCDTPASTGNAWPFRVGSDFGVLFRVRSDAGRLHYATLRLDGTTIPHGVVGSDSINYTGGGGGYQPRAVAVGDRIVFTERRGEFNRCHAIRVMNLDGSDAHDAPWQLPCHGDTSFDWGTSIVPSIELIRFGQGMVLVYAEHTLALAWLTSDHPWEEGLFAVLLTKDGRRGSDVVRITDADATALYPWPRTRSDGPFAEPFNFGAATNPDGTLVVAWFDQRESAPGIYARRLRLRSR